MIDPYADRFGHVVVTEAGRTWTWVCWAHGHPTGGTDPLPEGALMSAGIHLESAHGNRGRVVGHGIRRAQARARVGA